MAAAGILAVALALATWVRTDSGREFRSGAALADLILERAESNGGTAQFDFGSQVCVSPGSGFAKIEAQKFFPGRDISFLESDESEGFWYVTILNKSNTIEVYEIRRTKIQWYSDPKKKYSDYLFCPKAVNLSLSGDAWSVESFVK
jgi:hypothetical protein